MMDARSVVIRPIVSEKSFEMIEQNRYTFQVDKRSSKPQIALAIAEIFDVTVLAVNTMNVPGKPRRLRSSKGHTSAWKKAIVTLKAGDSIEFFEGH
ncbi:MAG: 50S ribosomal protein L23 [Actinobacteria bacterium]|nr:50S ribosomal protein L23 [Actinomycetota bacterium]MDP2232598.1 50S ribosomal protein L23 [Actinomycetota bacterium]